MADCEPNQEERSNRETAPMDDVLQQGGIVGALLFVIAVLSIVVLPRIFTQLPLLKVAMIAGEQIKAARMSPARAVGYQAPFIIDFEAGRRARSPEACSAIQRPLEAGVEFPKGDPPQLKSRGPPS